MSSSIACQITYRFLASPVKEHGLKIIFFPLKLDCTRCRIIDTAFLPGFYEIVFYRDHLSPDYLCSYILDIIMFTS